jgi:hypothetical protein
MRKPRGPQKGLPNSARDLLPLLQPATKALAQMLAGRTQMSGQLEQARAMLSQAERLIAERVHNRLNPAEREEFFEQLARLRLTLADAYDEAEVRAAEEQGPRPPQPPPIAQERLKEMALALASPEGGRRRAAAPPSPLPEDEEPAPAPRDDAESLAAAPASGERAEVAEPEVQAPADDASAGPRRLLAIHKPGRLELPKDAATDAARSLSVPRGVGRRRIASAKSAAAATTVPAQAERVEESPGPHDPGGGNGLAADPENAEKAKAIRRSRKTQQGLPEGWIIDEDGFVVPGPS